jgi:hypothetical protein
MRTCKSVKPEERRQCLEPYLLNLVKKALEKKERKKERKKMALFDLAGCCAGSVLYEGNIL